VAAAVMCGVVMGWNCDGKVAMNSCILPLCLHVAMGWWWWLYFMHFTHTYCTCTYTIHVLATWSEYN